MSGHNHMHHDGESCTCGQHDHDHDENCSCGHHDHEHGHEGHAHDENGNCIPESGDAPGAIQVELHLHDEARVVSGKLTLAADYDAVKTALAGQLERLAAAVQDRGGIVGHIKASCDVRTVEMYSVTDREVTVKRTPEQEIRINLAAIVFLVAPDEAEAMVREALDAVRKASADAWTNT